MLADERGRSAGMWVVRLQTQLDPISRVVGESLVERGVLLERRRRLLGLIPRTRYPEADPGPERELRARLKDVLLSDRTPGEDEPLLLPLLSAYDLIKTLVPEDRREEAHARAGEIAGRGPASEMVQHSVGAVAAAALTAAVVSTKLSISVADGGDGGGGG